jgi:tetratricopeptide (TPR) repeat protein
MRRLGATVLPHTKERSGALWARACVLAALCWPIGAATGHAQTARELYDQGMQALSAGRFEDAAKALDASYRKQPVAVALYNLGLAYKGAGHVDRALDAFESYVKYADPKKDGKTISAVRAEIDRIKSTYARFALKLTPPDAAIDLDGTPTSTSHGELWVQTGKHKVSIRANNYESYEQTLDVTAGHFDLEVHLRDASGPPDVRAGTLVDEGIALQAAGNMQGAIDKFNSAQAVYPTARGVAQLGLAEESVGDLPAAEQHLNEALAKTKDPFIRENKKKLKTARDRVKQQLSTLNVIGSPEGAEVFVNGKSVGILPITAPIRVAAGSFTVTAKKQGYSQFEQLFELPKRATRTIRIQMDIAPPPPVAVIPVLPVKPPEVAPVPALAEQPAAPTPLTNEPAAPPTQADIEAGTEPPPDQEPQPLGPKPSAAGFEMALNFGYQPLLAGPKMDGSSGLIAMQIVLGARIVWPLSFGVQIDGGADFSVKGTSIVSAINPGVYVRGHTLHYKAPLSLDGWAGVGLQPLAVQIAALNGNSSLSPNTDPNTVAPNSAQARLLQQDASVDRVHTVQSLNVPFELGGTFYVTEAVGFDLAAALTLWLPQQSCLHENPNRQCTSANLKSQTTLFIGGGVSFLL